MEVSEPWYTFLCSGEKKVEGRKKSPKWANVKVGQFLMLSCENRSCWMLITAIREYPSLGEYLLTEGVSNCLPGIHDFNEAIDIYKQWSTEEELAKYPFLAIELWQY